MARSQPPATRCRLLELPAELRNRIYEFVFEGIPTAIRDIYTTRTNYCLCETKYPILPACYPHNPYGMPGMLATCRQIASEAGGMFYPHVRLGAIDPWGLVRFLEALGDKKAGMLTHIRYTPHHFKVVWQEAADFALRTRRCLWEHSIQLAEGVLIASFGFENRDGEWWEVESCYPEYDAWRMALGGTMPEA